MAWTPERTEELSQLWNAGHSASAIGKKLGVSKNAVVGKAHRMKLPPRPSPIRRQSKTPAPARKAAPALAKPAAAAPNPVAVATNKKTSPSPAIQTQAHPNPRKCQWPFGDPAKPGFHFCEEAAVPGKPYCAEHCAAAYVVRSRERRSRAA